MLKAGVSCLDITPPLGTLIPGLFHERKAEVIHDPLLVRAFVLDSGTQAVAVSVCDLIGVKREHLDRAKSRVEDAVGLAAERVLICCTHTHTGAQTGDDAYTEMVISRIADAVVLAWSSRQPAEVGWGLGHEDRVVFNRRFRMKDGSVRTNPGVGNPDVVETVGVVDPDVGVLCSRAESGEPIGLLANYSLHYVGGGDGERTISADYFGFFSSLIQRMKGERFVAALSNGACGDINNIEVLGGPPRSVNDRYQHTERVAGRVASAALWAWNEMTFKDEAAISAAIREVSLKRKAPPSEADLQRVREIEDSDGPTMSERAFVRRITRRMADVPETVPTWVQAMRVGDLALVGVPGELLVDLGLEIKRRSPFGQTMILELANDSVGYLPTLKAYEEGGYEPEASVFAPGVGEQIVETAVELLKEIHG